MEIVSGQDIDFDHIPGIQTNQAGIKVKFTNQGGTIHDQAYAAKHLALNEVYTISHLDVHGFYTDLYLQDRPDLRFNSCCFEYA